MRSTTRAPSLLGRLKLTLPLVWSVGAAVALAPLVAPTPAYACGCFAPTSVATPVVQAGEKILFAQQNGMTVMQVQVQYSGSPSDFGWLLPLPAVSMNSAGMPGIDVGSQEVFDVLTALTQPTYSLTTLPCNSSSNRSSGPGCGSGDDLFGTLDGAFPTAGQNHTPVVTQSSVGPYDFAILKADNKDEMFNWLSANHYVVPAGTDAVVAPYIRPGGFFLALRLKAGQTAGDLQPVVLRYQSDLPMVPLVLTSASATPNMGILIWVLGQARAIPRNYANLVIDDAQLDWLNQVKNYADVVAKAVREVDGHHGFVTEFAGASSILSGTLGASSRFTYLDGLTGTKDPVQFVAALLSPGRFGQAQGVTLNGQLTGLLAGYIPMPAALAINKVTLSDYYQSLDGYLNVDRKANPVKYQDIEAALAKFDPAMLVSDLKARIVTPTLAAQTLFADPTLTKLTRLYTVMSPDDMNRDPAFSFNRDLPDVPKDHSAQLQSACPKDGFPKAVLTTASGWKVEIENASTYPPLSVPYAQRVETLMDTGMATVTVDNSDTIQKSLSAAGPGVQGCTALSDGRRHPTAGTGMLALMGLGIGLGLLRRRPARSRG